MPIMVGGVIEKEGKFLLVQEAKESCRCKWNLPAGHLEKNESLFDGAKREIFEETGFNIDLTGVLQISNRVFEDKLFVGFMFATKIINENIDFNTTEIMNAKWFTYEELLSMKDDLRLYYWIINAIQSYRNNNILSLDIINMDSNIENKEIKNCI